MKKILIVFVAFISIVGSVSAQKKKDWSKINLDPAGDHLMVQFSSDHWAGAPDSISSHIKGFSRGFNMYLMMNKPFKTDPRWSVAYGIGVGSSNIFFKSVLVNVKSLSATLPFTSLDSTDHFKKIKLATAFLEAPIEIRYTFDPENQKKSWKIALGVKVGTMLSAHIKQKTLETKSGSVINNYVMKENKKIFFNSTRLSATARVGYGNYSVFGAFQFTTLLKNGAGPAIYPYQIGICLSGL